MIDALAMELFTRPMQITGVWRLGMLLPLLATVSIVYRTLHSANLRDIPLGSLRLFFTILAGMMSIGVALWAIFLILV